MAERCARELAEGGQSATFVPVPVSGLGIQQAVEAIRLLDSEIVVALGQTPTEPRVERFGRAPGAWAPAGADELAPWLLAPDADGLVASLNAHLDPAALTAPFRASEDAGAYFCDHLCVELVREVRRRPFHARFLHITAIDGCSDDVRDARLRQYVRQARACVEWLMGLSSAGAVQ